MSQESFAAYVAIEVARARKKHPPINSLHEGYAVILEELDEFWEEVRRQSGERDNGAMLHELTQIAAMAERTAQDCGLSG